MTTFSLAERNHLATTANILDREFKGTFATEVIERFLDESLDQLLGGATSTPSSSRCSRNDSPASAAARSARSKEPS